MGDWYVGELRIFPFNTVPAGWLQCQGQLLQIRLYAALYSLLGIQFGGDAVNTFALPDLRGRLGISQNLSGTGTQYIVGKTGGVESVALTAGQLPTHAHAFAGTSIAATGNSPSGALLANATGNKLVYKAWAAGTQTTLDPGSIEAAGNSAPHENRQPYLALNICIATQGLYPPRP